MGMVTPTATATTGTATAHTAARPSSSFGGCGCWSSGTENEVADAKRLERLSHLLQEEGASPFEVIVALPDGRFRVSAPESRVRLTADLERQLRDDFGPECVMVERE